MLEDHLRIVASTALLLAAAIAGCYRYVPVTRSSLVAGEPVSIALTLQGSIDAAPHIGNNVASVEGTVTEADSTGGVALSLLSVRRRGENVATTWSGESIRLSSADIEEIKGKQFSRGRTAAAWTALGVASVGVIVAIARSTELVSGSSGGRPIPPP
ncbi:MAG TPA: hypothetical protein VJ867_12265 [Gemmatimonadaceae bacterium]|nr:hypothetical protein [Gemmatimonadaceae bacterium]